MLNSQNIHKNVNFDQIFFYPLEAIYFFAPGGCNGFPRSFPRSFTPKLKHIINFKNWKIKNINLRMNLHNVLSIFPIMI